MMQDFAVSFLRGFSVTFWTTLVLALIPGFHRECQPLNRRLSWFFLRYAFPYYCLLMIIRSLALLVRGSLG